MKEPFNLIITEKIKPYLKINGFNKKALNFYAKKGELIFIINFQNSHGNNSEQIKFYMNCGIYSKEIDLKIGKEVLDFPKEYECHFRRRISSIVQSEDDRFIITEQTNSDELTSRIFSNLKVVIEMFANITSTKNLTNLMIHNGGLDHYNNLFEYLLITDEKEDLTKFVKQLYKNYGNQYRWKIFESSLNEIIIEKKIQTSIAEILKI